MNSILQKEKKCFLCGSCANNLEQHHIFGGTANRKLSEKYGLKVLLCGEMCHRNGKQAVHRNKEVALWLKTQGQKRFEEVYPDLDFIQIFGRNYL